MTRSPGAPVLFILFLCASPVVAQVTSAPQPGGSATPGATRPALPSRDRPVAPTSGTGRLRGTVASSDGSPLRRAQVSVIAAELQVRQAATSDGEGRWEVTDLPAGRYQISVSKAGFVTMQYGQRRPFEPGTPVVLADGQTVERLQVALPRGAVIAGRITDEFGEPIGQAMVQAMRYQYSAEGQRRLTVASSAATDDRGDFRVYGLMPGDYVVNASVRGILIVNGALVGPSGTQAPESFAPTYYPGTANAAEAQTVTLGVGQESAVQFQLVPARMSRLTGVVVMSDGKPAVGASLSLTTPTGDTGFMSTGAGVTATDGSFTIANVSAGEHSLSVRPARVVEGAEFGNLNFTATGETMNVRIVTTKGATISGRVTWEGTATRGTAPLRVFAQGMTPPGVPTFVGGALPGADGTVNEDGTFRLSGASGKVILRAVSIPLGWALKSVTVDGEDITDVSVDLSTRPTIDDIRVVLTDKMTDLSGQVTDARGTPSKDFSVVLLPSALKEGVSPARFIRVIRPDGDGRYRLKGLPAGRYTATALEWIEQGRQFVPEFQEQLRREGKAVTLKEGESVTLDLKMSGL